MKTLSKSTLIIIKLLFSIGLIGYLVIKIKDEPVLNYLNNTKIIYPQYIIITSLLMLVNWALESKKWQILIKPVQYISFITATKSVLAGLSTGLITPNRLGNFIGRLSFIKKEHHNQAIVNTLIGNLSQFISTLTLGLIGFLTLLYLEFEILNNTIIISISAVLTIGGLLLYFKPSIIDINPINQFFSEKTRHSIQEVESTKHAIKINILCLSLIRYLVFCIQYYLLFLAFGSTSFILYLSLISSTFLITTLIPSLFFGKLFVRESVAIFVFSLGNVDTTLVLIVAFLLWLINLAVPALIGSLIWLKQKQND